MPKPRIFVASSSEKIDLAYAAQEELDQDLEVTVWSQGVFGLSRSGFVSLVEMMNKSDFGLFIFAPDDTIKMRAQSANVIRDNVIFELGMFVGKLGMERCFIFVPKDVEDLHLPTDLAGINPAYFSADRQDGNVRATLGPACNQVRTAVRRIWVDQNQSTYGATPQVDVQNELTENETDCIILIQSWMGSRPIDENTSAIRFDDVDSQLRLVRGSARKYIERAALRWDYILDHKGEHFILFKKKGGEFFERRGVDWRSS